MKLGKVSQVDIREVWPNEATSFTPWLESHPEELGELAVFFCSPVGNNIRGVAWNMDGGWAAQ